MTSASSYSEQPVGEPEHPRGSDRTPDPELESLPEREPADTEQDLLHGAPPAAGQVQIIVQPQALAQVEAHSTSDAQSEVGGVLLGEAYRHQGTTFVEIKSALPAVSDDHGPIHFTFNADAWSQIHRDRATRFPNLAIVGWFHTHPGLGVFYSADDVVVHRAAFVMPWHVGLVVDPLRGEAAFFGWVDGAIAPLEGFFERLDETGESRLPWDPQPAAVWEETREAAARPQRFFSGVPTGSLSSPAVPAGFWLSVILGTLALLLTVGLLFGGILPLYARNNALRGVVVALASDNLAQAAASGDAVCPESTLRLYAPLAGKTTFVSDSVDIVGSAHHPDAAAYEIALRPNGEQDWWTLHTVRRDVRVGRLMQWDRSQYPDGEYQLRLTALDRSREPLAGVTPCIIDFSLAR